MELWKRSILQEEEALAEKLLLAPVQDTHRLWRAMKTGTWMTVQPSTVNGTEMGAQEL